MWAKEGVCASGNATPYGIATDSANNVYVVGQFNNQVNFGDGLMTGTFAPNATDIFVVKYSSTGTLLWKKQIGGSGNDNCYGVIVDSHDNIIIAGNVQNTVDFGNGAVSIPSSTSGFVAKYTSAGAYVWAKVFTGINFGVGANVIALAALDNIAVAVQTTIGADFGNGFTFTIASGSGFTDLGIAKLSGSDGHTLWAANYGGGNYESARSLALLSGGDYIVGGQVQGNTTNLGGQTLTATGSFTAFVARYSGVNGAHVWSKLYGLNGGNAINAVAVDLDVDNVYIGGITGGTIDLGGGVVGGGAGLFLAGLNSAGAYLWSKFSGSGGVAGTINAIIIKNGRMALTGRTADALYFGSGLSLFGNGNPNAFIAFFAIDGFARSVAPVNTWLRYLGTGLDRASVGTGITLDLQYHVLAGGAFLGTEDFVGPPSGAYPSSIGNGSFQLTTGTAGFQSTYLVKYY